jgi:tRNA(Arg) A34 adenosine deaminase TadA
MDSTYPSRKIKRLKDITYAVALSGNGVGGRTGNNFKLGAVLFDSRGRVVSAKVNSLKTHPLLTRFTKYPFLHAEQAAILSQGLDNCRGLNLMVLRLRKDNSIGGAKPCEVCSNMIKLAGIRTVYYSCDNGDIHNE